MPKQSQMPKHTPPSVLQCSAFQGQWGHHVAFRTWHRDLLTMARQLAAVYSCTGSKEQGHSGTDNSRLGMPSAVEVATA